MGAAPGAPGRPVRSWYGQGCVFCGSFSGVVDVFVSCVCLLACCFSVAFRVVFMWFLCNLMHSVFECIVFAALPFALIFHGVM